MSSNGSPLMLELTLLEPGQRETSLLDTKEELHSERVPLLSLEPSRPMTTPSDSDGFLEERETSKTMENNASTFPLTLKTDTLPTGPATMVKTNHGSSTKLVRERLDHLLLMELNSESDQEWLVEELLQYGNILELVNSD